jgi:hypothetical protein
MKLNLVQKIMIQNLAILLVFLGLSTILGQIVKTNSIQAQLTSAISQ